MNHAFSIQDTAIDCAALTAHMDDATAGACVTFEGRVRNHNEGRDVTHLFYEAAPELVNPAFDAIAKDVFEHHDITAVHCVHRIGELQIGDIAVWIGVTAPHRAAAFDACRFTIDELKKRVPVWKKEFYTDGDSGWINHP